MKNTLIIILISMPVWGYAQGVETIKTIEYDPATGKVIKESFKKNENAETTQLNGVTFGIGMGYSYLFDNPKDYFLTSDASYKLQIQELSRSGIVLSSVISIKLGKMSVQKQSDGLNSKKKLVSTNRIINKGIRVKGNFTGAEDGTTNDSLRWYERFAVNISLNLAELNGGNIAFNKSIDGGIGLGYYFNEFTQLAVFFDMIRIRQMRDYFVKNYENQSIPNGTGVYNALDQTDNNLFYNKYYPGISIKVIFSLGNK